MEKSSRLEYIDALRGVAILLVVYQHVLTYGIFNGWVADLTCPWSLATFAIRFRMPLFFFISGLLACASYDAATLRRRVMNRLSRQLWPTVAVCLIYNALFFWRGWHSLFFSSHNAGYWFTQSLVQVFVVYALAEFLMQRAGLGRKGRSVLLGIAALSLVAMQYFHWIPSGRAGGLIEASYIHKSVIYAPFFFTGVIARLWMREFVALIGKWYVILLCVAAIVASCWVGSQQPVFPLGIAGIIMMTGIFSRTGKFWISGKGVSGVLKEMGRNTLPIYLYHYIVLQFVANHHLFSYLRSSYGKAWELPVVLILSISVASLCMLFDQTVKRYLKPVHRILYSPVG